MLVASQSEARRKPSEGLEVSVGSIVGRASEAVGSRRKQASTGFSSEGGFRQIASDETPANTGSEGRRKPSEGRRKGPPPKGGEAPWGDASPSLQGGFDQ
jgi:hypothetical protein